MPELRVNIGRTILLPNLPSTNPKGTGENMWNLTVFADLQHKIFYKIF